MTYSLYKCYPTILPICCIFHNFQVTMPISPRIILAQRINSIAKMIRDVDAVLNRRKKRYIIPQKTSLCPPCARRAFPCPPCFRGGAQRPPGDGWGEELVLPLRKGDYSMPSRKQYLTASRWLFLNSNLYPFGHFISGRGTDGSPYAISTSFMQKASLGILFGYALQVKAYLSMQFTQAAQRR